MTAFSSSVASVILLLSFFSIATSQCITSFSNDTNYFPDGYSSPGTLSLPLAQTVVGTAKKFSVLYSNANKLVYNSFANTSYLLYQCGAPVTDAVNATVKPIEVPVTAAAIDSTIQIGFLELLGLLPQLKAISLQSTAAYVNSPCFQKLIGQDYFTLLNDSTTELLDFDGIVFSALQGMPTYDSNYVQFDAAQDPGPLRRAEWIKYLAVFFNAEATATSVYQQIEDNYQCLNGSSTLTTKPVVAWISQYPEGVFTIDNATYKTQLTVDAGASNVEGFGIYNLSVPADAASFYNVLKDVNVLIDEIYAPDPTLYNLTSLLTALNLTADSEYPFLMEKRVWREDRRVQNGSLGLDWFEGSLAQPQIILQELLGLVDPSRNHTHHFFRNIAMGEEVTLLTASDCTASDPTAALEPTIYACPVNPETVASPPSSAPSAGSKVTFGVVAITSLVALVIAMLCFQ